MNLKEIDNNIHILNDFDSKIGEIKQLNDDFLTIELDLIISDIKYLDKVILFLMKRLKNKMYKNVIIKHKPVGNVKICSEFLNLLLQYDLINTDTNDSEIILNIRLNSNNLTNKNAKVIPLWFGPRRKWAKYTEDYKKEFLKMFEFILNKEINLDKGIDCDTIFYINNPFDENLRNETASIKEYIYSFNNKKTKNGTIKVFERQNIGISYGAFSEAFEKMSKEYDFWFFTEDDYIMLKENYLKNDYILFKKILNNIGYISETGVCLNFPRSNYPTHVHFGLGFTSRNILHECVNNFRVLCNCNVNKDGAENQHLTSEIPFTNNIYKLGYDLVDSENLAITLEWRGYNWVNTRKMVAFNDTYLK